MNEPSKQTRLFYQNNKLVTLVSPEQRQQIFRTPDTALAEARADGGPALLGTDAQGSVLMVQSEDQAPS
ncbi:hypothetical protein ACSFEV_20210 [Pseudomonas fulva]|uniref:hypothetical protein n=1 Tax=Pseudomonas putida group TaxID=136845 RepID=UPI0015F76713|nr:MULTISPECIES: hypothetical protein [Pseudomonas putida group]MBA5708395.1 hypothetical protein [Pseudomonas fulva]MBF8726154.1 hypothetical protein [Pseudomonas putida]